MEERVVERSRFRPAAALAVLAIALIAPVAAGCGGDDEEEPAEPAVEETTTEETTTEETTTAEDDSDEGAAIDPGQGDPGAGQQIFANNCSTCHGNDGGGGATGPSLQEPELAEEQGDVVEQIVNGGGGMPPFGDQLSDQEIADVAAYVINDLAGG